MTTEVAPGELLRPWWQRVRLWFGLAAIVVIGAVLVGTLSDEPGRPLDPASAHKDGSKALARLLEQFGVDVTSTSNLTTALDAAPGRAVLVTAPDDYSTEQLRRMRDVVPRLVLVRPGTRTLHAVAPQLEPDSRGGPGDVPACSDPGARAAGAVSFPDDTITYVGAVGQRCYDGAVVMSPDLAVLGSADLLRNDHLAHRGVAALDVNTITDSRRVTSVVWLLPGADTAGSGPASVWDLFPPGAYRAFWWLLAVGVLIAVWRARRLGAVVSEPLPVVVHSAEVVEGHGRLYARAGARDRAAAALRAAAVRRLGHRLGLPRGATAEQVGVAIAPTMGRSPAEVVALLAGPMPADDVELIGLAQDLDTLESAVGGSTEGNTT